MSEILIDLARTTTDKAVATAGRQTDCSADDEESSSELDTSLQLQALDLQNDELRRANSVLNRKVSSLEAALANANQFAHYDELTGLPNRRLLLDRFNQGRSLADRHDHGVALLFFDLNEFKSVNDKLGHEAGDTLLQQVALRLNDAIREADTACRYGGDEFVILLTEIDHHEEALKALQKIRAALAPPFVIDRHPSRVTISDGMAIYPQDGRTFAELMRLSDQLMLRNKSRSEVARSGVQDQ